MRGFLIPLVVLAVLAFAFAVGQDSQSNSNSKSGSTVDEAPKGKGDPLIAEEIQKNKAKPGSGDPPPTQKDPNGGAVSYSRRQLSVHGRECRGQCSYAPAGKTYSCIVIGAKGYFNDPCSPRPNTDRLGNDCTSPCVWHFDPFASNQGYYWCYSKSGTWYGCGPHQ